MISSRILGGRERGGEEEYKEICFLPSSSRSDLSLDIDSGGIRSYRVKESLQSLLRFKGTQYLYITKRLGKVR